MSKRLRSIAAALLTVAACAASTGAQPAEAFNPVKPVCAVGGLISGLVGKACTVLEHGGRIISAGKKLASGHLGGAIKTALGGGGSSVGSKATFALGLAAVVTWVLGGAKYVLHATADVIGHTTSPQLRSTWFSATYWRVAGIAAVLTLPFLFAAGIQALIQSDLSVLARATLGYLPLAMLAVSIAAPMTMLLLAAADQMSAVVSSAAGDASAHFLNRAAGAIGGLTLLARSPFLVFFVGILTVAGAIMLWLELLLRAAAVYVIVLMLPLAFAAFVWPARRVWAIRAVEVLIALILSKFLIVAVLSLGGAAFSQSFLSSISGTFAGLVLLVLSAIAPWALLRLLPLGELASGAMASLRGEMLTTGAGVAGNAFGGGMAGHEWASTTAEMRRQADDVSDTDEPQPITPPPPFDAPPGKDDPLAGVVPQPGAGAGAEDNSSDSRAPVTAGGASAPASERSPGLGPIWQMDDFTWPTLSLGLEPGWPPKPLEEQLQGGTGPDRGEPGRAVPDEALMDPGARERISAAPEDHDPTPPPQPPDAGSL